MLYRCLLLLVERGLTDGLAEKVDTFFALGRITEQQYTELTEKLTGKTPAQ